jgi:hypothetical protein
MEKKGRKSRKQKRPELMQQIREEFGLISKNKNPYFTRKELIEIYTNVVLNKKLIKLLSYRTSETGSTKGEINESGVEKSYIM